MKAVRIIGYCITAFIVAITCVACAKASDGEPTAESVERRASVSGDQETQMARIREIFALAKKTEEDDGNVNFFGFFMGMSCSDAAVLAQYYNLKDDEWLVENSFEMAVWRINFSLKGVRRITKAGHTFGELLRGVENRIGDFSVVDHDLYLYKTIDGVVVTMSETKGLTIRNVNEERLQKIKIENEERLQKNKITIKRIEEDMAAIPGKNFKMGKYEVTQLQWELVMGNNPSRFGDGSPNYPVENVSWEDCQEFLTKLNAFNAEVKHSTVIFRLPTQEEWEYACRAGATGDYCKLADGTEVEESSLGDVAWFACGKTRRVGMKKPNAFGLYDKHGNVWEWTQTTSAIDGARFYCGGSWDASARFCISSFRNRASPSFRSGGLGFRLCASGKTD